MMWLLSVFVSLLADNIILTKALGTSTLMAASKSRSNLLVLSVLITFFSAGSCFLAGLVLQPFETFDIIFATQLYTIILSMLYIAVLLGLYKLCRKHFVRLKKYVHLSAFNCAVTGTLYLYFDGSRAADPIGGLLFGLLTGLGFFLVSVLLTTVKGRLYSGDVPAAFRGMPAVMLYIGLLSMAVYALTM